MASRACLAAAVAAGSSRGAVAFGRSGVCAATATGRSISTLGGGGRSAFVPSSRQGTTSSSSSSLSLASTYFANNSYGSRASAVNGNRSSANSIQLHMSSTEATKPPADITTTTSSFPRRVKTANAEVSEEMVSIKGWVRTVRKQKTLAFVEVNDGSSMSGIQCVLPFDQVDEDTLKGEYETFYSHFLV